MKHRFMNRKCRERDKSGDSGKKALDKDWFNDRWTDQYDFSRDWFNKKWFHRYKFS